MDRKCYVNSIIKCFEYS